MKKLFFLLFACALFACHFKRIKQPNSLMPKDNFTKFQLKPSNEPVKYAMHGYSKNTWASYLPDTNRLNDMPMREIRINFHIIDNAEGTQNFKPEAGRIYMKELLRRANMDLAENVRNWRSPEGTPVLERRYRYVLWPQLDDPNDDGIYFHKDDEHYFYVVSGKNQNNYNRKAIEKYTIGGDSILNVFVQVHHPDSLKSKTYRGTGQAIALGTAIKLSGLYEFGEPPENFRGMFNHEFGHILGLAHAWGNDGCDDTETHPNKCYKWTREPPCDKLATNNMMDYNAYEIALTPCQIGKIHGNLSNESHRVRKSLIRTWCRVDDWENVRVQDSVEWSGARDLKGNITIESGGYLAIHNRVSLPENARINVEAGGTLVLGGAYLHNSCGYTWQGIFVKKLNESEGKVYVLSPSKIENTPTDAGEN